MSTGISISDIVQVSVDISPTAVPYTGFGNLVILGSSPVIDVAERYRLYSGGETALAAIAADFGTTSPEYLAADLFFSQVPQPDQVYMGRWAQTASPGVLHGAILTPAQQLLSNFTSVTNGSFEISIDGTAHAVTGLNFAPDVNINGVAATVQAALPTGVTFAWNSVYKRFTLVSGTTGTASSVSYATTATSGTDVSSLLGLTLASGASVPVAGIAAETLASCVSYFANNFNTWYGLTVATATPPATADYLAVAAFIEGTGNRIFGITTQDTSTLLSTQTNDLCSQLQLLGYSRTAVQYSSTSPYAIVSYFGRFFTVDFTAQNSTITGNLKQEPGVTAETLPSSYYKTLLSKGCNVLIDYSSPSTLVQGIRAATMINGRFTDEVINLDWFTNRVQTDLFNVLYQTTTKIPQTDAGVHVLVNAATVSCQAAVFNGAVAEGQWNANGFGSLVEGTIIPGGFYIYVPPIATQSQSIREQRTAPAMQIALKLAGAIQDVPVIVSVNR